MLRVQKADEALAKLDAVIERSERVDGFTDPWKLAGRALAFHELGRVDEARAEHQRFIDSKRNEMWTYAETLEPLAEELQRKVPLDSDPDRTLIRDLLIESEQALWLNQDIEQYFAIRPANFVAVEGRSDVPDSYDRTYERDRFAKMQLIRTTSALQGRPMCLWQLTEFEKDSNTVTLSGTTTLRFWNGLRRHAQQFQFTRQDGNWVIVQQRSWPLEINDGDNKVIYDTEVLKQLDQDAADALAENDHARAAKALMAGLRFKEALIASQKRLQEEGVTAEDYVRHAELALMGTMIDQAWDSLQKAFTLDSSVELPWFATRLKRSFVGHKDAVYGAHLNPADENILVSASRDKSLIVWDRNTGQSIRTIEDAHAVSAFEVVYSHDGTKIISTGADSLIKVWDPETGVAEKSMNGHLGQVYRLGPHPSENLVVSASADRSAKIWDIDQGREVVSLVGHDGAVIGAEFNPDGSLVATAGDDHSVRIWDARTGKQQAKLIGHTAGVWRVHWSVDGKYLVSGGKDKTIRLWDAKGHRLLATMYGPKEMIEAVRISPDGRLAASGDAEGEIWIWDLAEHKAISVLRPHRVLFNLKFSEDGKSLFSSSENHMVQEWNVDFETNPFERVRDFKLE
jgi:hypothetical protein